MSDMKFLHVARAIQLRGLVAKSEGDSYCRNGQLASAAFNHGVAEGCEFALAKLARLLGVDAAALKEKLKAEQENQKANVAST